MAILVFTGTVSLSTNGFADTIDITDRIAAILEQSEVGNGLATVFCTGSTGAVTTIEYESGVVNDLKRTLEKIVPSDISYEHDKRWGDGNGFAHVRAALVKPSLSIPVISGKLSLGRWQQVVFIDFDNRKRQRSLIVQVIGNL